MRDESELRNAFEAFRRLMRRLYADPPNSEWIGRNVQLIQDCNAAVEAVEKLEIEDDD